MTNRYRVSVIGCLIMVLVLTASGSISVGNVAVTPQGDIVAGETKVTASFLVDFISEGGDTFSADNSLLLSTGLANATWNPVLIQNGVENPRPVQNGPNFDINGWELSYPASKNEISLRVSMEGNAPQLSASGNVTIFKVAELNSKNQEVKDSTFILTKFVTNPAEIQSVIASKKNALADLRENIDEAAASGVDTSAAEEKYNAAATSIQSAEKATAFAVKQGHVTAAQASIDAGKKLVEDVLVQQMITQAQEPIDLTNEQIEYFRVNLSIKKDPRVDAIEEKRDNAEALLSTATDFKTQGNFQEARNKAAEAKTIAEEAYEEAIDLRKSVGEFNPLGMVSGVAGGVAGGIGSILIYIVAIVVVAVVVVIAIVLYRRRDRWDELG